MGFSATHSNDWQRRITGNYIQGWDLADKHERKPMEQWYRLDSGWSNMNLEREWGGGFQTWRIYIEIYGLRASNLKDRNSVNYWVKKSRNIGSYGQKLGCDLRDDKVQGGAMHVSGKVKVVVHKKIWECRSQSVTGATPWTQIIEDEAGGSEAEKVCHMLMSHWKVEDD